MKRAEKGGDELMLRAVPPGYQLNVKTYKKNGMPVRVPAKRLDEQPLAERLWQLLDEAQQQHFHGPCVAATYAAGKIDASSSIP